MEAHNNDFIIFNIMVSELCHCTDIKGRKNYCIKIYTYLMLPTLII